MKLITETTEDIKILQEKTETGKKRLYIEGTFLVANKVNKNNRMYEMDNLRSKVNGYINEFVKNDNALGELNHPQNASINLDRVSHKIISLEEDGESFKGKALVLENLPCGAILKNLIEEGVKVGVSSRALGSLKQTNEGHNIVQDDLYIVTAADVVHNPSASVFVQGIMEGKEFWFDQAKGTIIETNVEQLHEQLKKYTSKQIEDGALNLFDWYLQNISKKVIL
jgi:hypothetical protein